MRRLLPPGPDLAEEDLPDLYGGSHDGAGPTTRLRAGMVVGLDGGAALAGSSLGLSGPADRSVLRALRTVSDAVLVAAGTARAEDYGPVRHREAAMSWRRRHELAPQTPLVVISRRGRFDPAARMFAGPVLVVVPETAAIPELPVQVLRVGRDEVDLPRTIELLHEQGLRHLVCEGGPGLLTDLLAARLVDELCVTHSPQLGGGGLRLLTTALPEPARLHLRTLLYDDPGFLMARYDVLAGPDQAV